MLIKNSIHRGIGSNSWLVEYKKARQVLRLAIVPWHMPSLSSGGILKRTVTKVM